MDSRLMKKDKDEMSTYTDMLERTNLLDDQMENEVIQDEANDIVQAENAFDQEPNRSMELTPLQKLLAGQGMEQPQQDVEQYATPFNPETDLNYPQQTQEEVPMQEATEMATPSVEANLEQPTSMPSSQKELSPQEQMLQEYRNLIAQRQQEVNEAREKDDSLRKSDRLGNIFKDMNEALSSGYANVKVNRLKDQEPLEEGRAEKDSKARLDAMMQEYKILSAKDKDQLSERDKLYLDYYNKKLKLDEQRLDRQDARQEKGFDEKDTDRKLRLDDKVYKVTKDFEKDDLVKEMKKQDISFSQADSLIREVKAGNSVALGALGSKMARAMGEVGVLTDKDVERYIVAQELVQKAKDKFGKNFRGSLSDETIKDLETINKKMLGSFEKKQKVLYDRYVNRAYENYGKQAGLSRQDVEQRFAMPSMGSTAPKVSVILPNGQKGSIAADKIEAFKKKYPDAKIME